MGSISKLLDSEKLIAQSTIEALGDTVKVPIADWEEIRKGDEYTECTNYWCEGKRFTACFHFNSPKKGGLLVTYDDGGEGFLGDISEATITGGEI